MTLPSSGEMRADMINSELGRSGSAYFELNGSSERQLAQRPGSGNYIAFSDFYGKSNCPPYGTFYYAWCSGCTYYYRYHNGSCGYYDQVIEYNSQNCGCCPSYGQLHYVYCSGCTYYGVYHNGGCGYYTQVIEYSSPNCGCCPAYYTLLYQTCLGCTLYNVRADGGCGSFYEYVQGNAPACGCCPAYGTFYSTYCSGCNYYYIYHDGSCGYYYQFIQGNASQCGCGGNACSGQCSSAQTQSGYVYVCGNCGWGGWGTQPYTDDSPQGAIATHNYRLSPGQCDYIYLYVFGCSGTGGSFQNCVQTYAYSYWCAMYIY